MTEYDFSTFDFSSFVRPTYSKKSTEELVNEANTNKLAAYELGERYERNRDYENALKSFKIAEQLGDKSSYIKIACILDQKKQYNAAADYFKKAIEHNEDLSAHVYLAMYYINKKVGVFRREKEGHKLLLAAAKKGYARAQYLLALTFVEGIGVSKNFDQYVFWMRCSQRNGYSSAVKHIQERASDPRYRTAWENMIEQADKRLNQHDEYFALERLTKQIMKMDY